MTRKLQIAIKRIFDICVSLLVLVPFLPIWVVIALLVKFTSPGPVFFLQEHRTDEQPQ
jgi:lipopolysaccharide/colanic/teichoic acid biosynthesis glycosyltransferase